MATKTTFKELLSMRLPDLQREVISQRMLLKKMRITIVMNKEKDTAQYRREKRSLARMMTALNKLLLNGSNQLKPKEKTPRVSAPSAV